MKIQKFLNIFLTISETRYAIELYTIDLTTIIDSSNIFLFTGDLVYKLINNSVGIEINDIQEIRDWDKNIEIPIDNSCGFKVCPSESCLNIKNVS